MNHPASDVAFCAAVKQVQSERGSRAAYARQERARRLRDRGHRRSGRLPGRDRHRLPGHRQRRRAALRAAPGRAPGLHPGGRRRTPSAFVDLPGNRQYVTTGNLRENDRVCLFLIDYARRQRVKVWGHARVVPAGDPAAAALAPAGPPRPPEQAILITVTAWDANCPKHIPQKLDAAEAEVVVRGLRDRIAALERENRALRAG